MKDKLRIGISCYPTHGGSGVLATELGCQLAKQGHEIALISYKAPLRLDSTCNNISFHEVPISAYPLLEQYPYTLALASKLAEVARNKQLQILHAHYAIPFAVAALLAKDIAPELNLKVITTLHGTDITLVGRNQAFQSVTSMAIRKSDACTAVSHYLKKETESHFKINRKIEVIYNFVDIARHSIIYNQHKNKSQNRKQNIIHISNFRPVKRLMDVIKIFSIIRRKLDVNLILVGDGPDANAARQLAKDLSVDKYIQWRGVVDAVEPLLAQADVMLLPSEYESFGLVALEAMACGVPVVASKVGGLPEVIKHGHNGYLANLGDIDTMANFALEILQKKQNHPFIKAGFEYAKNNFDETTIIAQYTDLYYKTIKYDT